MSFSGGQCNGQGRQALLPYTISGNSKPTPCSLFPTLLCSCEKAFDRLIQVFPLIASLFPFLPSGTAEAILRSWENQREAEGLLTAKEAVRRGKGLGPGWYPWAASTPSFWLKKQINPCPFKAHDAKCIAIWCNGSMWEVGLAEKKDDW